MSGETTTPADTLSLARANVRDILTASSAYREMPADKQREIAKHTVELATFLAQPHDGQVGTVDSHGRPATVAVGEPATTSTALAEEPQNPNLTAQPTDEGPLREAPKGGVFAAQAAREGANVAGALLRAVSFPAFCASLIQGVFHSIVQSSIEQMEAYGKLVADVAKTLNQFRDENTSDNQGRDHLIDQFPDLFEMSIEEDDSGQPSPKVRVREGIDDRAAVQRINNSLQVQGGPITSLDDDVVEERLVGAARTQLATSRQQLLATMVLMGINRIVVTDGRIQAKVNYEFQARDNMKFARSATRFDYKEGATQRVSEGEYDTRLEGGSHSESRDKDSHSEDDRGASYYAKGKYKTTEQPVLKLTSVETQTNDATLTARANLSGLVDINFKSDYLPLEKMADSFQIAQIQRAARPTSPAGSAANSAASGPAAAAPGTPATTAAPASTPAR